MGWGAGRYHFFMHPRCVSSGHLNTAFWQLKKEVTSLPASSFSHRAALLLIFSLCCQSWRCYREGVGCRGKGNGGSEGRGFPSSILAPFPPLGSVQSSCSASSPIVTLRYWEWGSHSPWRHAASGSSTEPQRRVLPCSLWLHAPTTLNLRDFMVLAQPALPRAGARVQREASALIKMPGQGRASGTWGKEAR